MFEILILALLGAVAGYAAGLLFGDKGFGPIGNMAVGVLGAVLGGFLLALVGGLLIKLFAAFAGAVILFWVISKIRKPKEGPVDKTLRKRDKYISD